ncbi:TVP38/TMEM64 family protein [Scandinavium sp.]|uniref:TVP38/TMEM64 family protein n=1 Tax=Scandinavium sp. TaxID=2830653 RepID=UPI00390C65E2
MLIFALHHGRMTDPLLHLSQLQTLIRQSGTFGAALYVLLFILAAVCFMPGSLLVIAGGVIFGPLYGTLLSVVASTLASSLCFLLARALGRDLLVHAFGQSAVFQAIENGIHRHGVDFLLFTRLIPLFPWTLQNYAYGLTAIAFWPFTLISILTTFPGLLIYTLMADDLATHGVTHLFFLKLCVAGALLFMLVRTAKAWARRKGVSATGLSQ